MQVAEYTSAAEMRAAHKARLARMAANAKREIARSKPAAPIPPETWGFIYHTPIGPSPFADPAPVSGHPNLNMSAIAEMVCMTLGVPCDGLFSPLRVKHYAVARHIFFFLARDMLNVSFPALGRFGKRDHSTACYSYQKVKQKYVDYAAAIAVIKTRLVNNHPRSVDIAHNHPFSKRPRTDNGKLRA